MTLTGPVDRAERERVEQALHMFFAPVLSEPVEVANVALFVEEEPGAPFQVHSLHPLGRVDRRQIGLRKGARQDHVRPDTDQCKDSCWTMSSLREPSGSATALIADISSNTSVPPAEDMAGDYLIPGLVELHTDHLEGHYAPRPKVRWNPLAAVLAHDAQIASSGITTVLDALRVGTDLDDATLPADDMLHARRRHRRGRVQGPTPARRPLPASALRGVRSDCHEQFQGFEGNARVRLASLMDHAPGQRQFRDLEAYAVYYQRQAEDVRAGVRGFLRSQDRRIRTPIPTVTAR